MSRLCSASEAVQSWSGVKGASVLRSWSLLQGTPGGLRSGHGRPPQTQPAGVIVLIPSIVEGLSFLLLAVITQGSSQLCYWLLSNMQALHWPICWMDKLLGRMTHFRWVHLSCSKWYDLPATQVTDEVKRDLRLLRLRGVMDPKRFYKSADQTKFPEYFQFGTVVEGPTEFYSGQQHSTSLSVRHTVCRGPAFCMLAVLSEALPW